MAAGGIHLSKCAQKPAREQSRFGKEFSALTLGWVRHQPHSLNYIRQFKWLAQHETRGTDKNTDKLKPLIIFTSRHRQDGREGVQKITCC
jgi:hypothetical protein